MPNSVTLATMSYDNLASQLRDLPFMSTLLKTEFYGNSLAHYLAILLVTLFVFIFAKIISFILEKYAKNLTSRTENKLDDLVVSIMHRSIGFILVLGTIYFGIKSLNVPESVDVFAIKAIFILFVLKVTKEFESFLEFLIQAYIYPPAQRQKGLVRTFLPPLFKFTKFIVWTLAILLIISNLGYNVSSLIAGFGLGGLAIALAAQETLSNAFGSFTILADQPFKVGDWVVLGEVEGEIKEIGIRSTKIQTLDRSIVSVPNTTVASSIIENYSRKKSWKVGQTLFFGYDLSGSQIRELIKAIEKIIRTDKDTEKDSFRVHFKDFGEYALEIELLYYITDTTSYARYLTIRQRINLKIKALTEKLGVEMVFPTKSLYIKNAKDFIKT